MSTIDGLLGIPTTRYSKAPLKQLQIPRTAVKKPLSASTNVPERSDQPRPIPLKEKIKVIEESILGQDSFKTRNPLTRMRSRSAGNLPDLVDVQSSSKSIAHPHDKARVEVQPCSGQSKFEQKRNLPLRKMRSKSLDHLPDLSNLHNTDPKSAISLLGANGKHSVNEQQWASRVTFASSPQYDRPHVLHTNRPSSALPPHSKQLDSIPSVRVRPATSHTSSIRLSSPSRHSTDIALMPCQLPENHILTRAERRVMSQAKSREIIRRNEEEMQEKIDSWEKKRAQREEAVIERKAQRERQLVFLPLVQMLIAGSYLHRRLKMERAREGSHPVYRKAASHILQCLPIYIKLRVLRKRRAVRVLTIAIKAFGMMPKVRTTSIIIKVSNTCVLITDNCCDCCVVAEECTSSIVSHTDHPGLC